MADLVGNWRKQSDEPCAARYPATLSIRAGGQYRGASDPPGGFAWWDVGTWRLSGRGKIEISTANDALVPYRYKLSDGALVFTDPEGCRIVYHREPDAEPA